MGQQLANVVLVCFASGCSLIYNPNNLPKPDTDAAIDAPAIDANPESLTVSDLAPAVILEGQGDGNSRQAILVIHGSNILSTAQVAITAGVAVKITVDNTLAKVSTASDYIAVPVKASVDGSVNDGDMIPLTVVVSQMTPTGMVMAPLTGKLTLRGLKTLDTPPANNNATNLLPLYSDVTLPAINFAGGQAAPVLIRAVAGIQIGDIGARGGTTTTTNPGGAGPGGCPGGPGAGDGGCGGGGHRGASTTLLSNGGGGGGAGFAAMGTGGTGGGAGAGGALVGDDLISNYSGTNANQAAGGGGGGAGTLSAGGGGGGGGGVVELTAGGDVMAGKIDVGGGAGGVAGSGGGGGAGGVIMVRSGHAITAGALTAQGGAGGSAANMGGAGADGRIRWDAPMGSAPNATPAASRGPSFTDGLVVTDGMVHLVGKAGKTFNVYSIDGGGHNHAGQQGVAFAGDGTATIAPPLSPGFNTVCVTLSMGQQMTPEADTCVDLAYMP